MIAHSMSYFELAQNHYPSDALAGVLAEEGAMTSIHSIPHLSLTHGGLANPEDEGSGDPGTEEPGTEEPGTEEPGTDEPGTDEPGTDEPDVPGADSGADDDTSGSSGDLAATGGHDYTPWFTVGLIVIGLGVTSLVGWRRRTHLG